MNATSLNIHKPVLRAKTKFRKMDIDGGSIIEYNITLLRGLHRLSMIDTAKLLKVSIEEYYKLETDVMEVSIETVFRASAFFSVPVRILMEGKIDPATSVFIDENLRPNRTNVDPPKNLSDLPKRNLN